jgi:hypothetical protein
MMKTTAGTTFLLPSELFPTDIRTETHGIAASWGKLGALTSTLVFSYGNNGKKLSPESIFIVNGFASLVGLILTVLLIPNTGNVSLSEVDRLWETQLLGKPYEGVALEPHNLSIVEAMMIYGRKAAFDNGPVPGQSYRSYLNQEDLKQVSRGLLAEEDEEHEKEAADAARLNTDEVAMI